MEDDIVIRSKGVYKDFILPHERVGSVKGVFTGMFSHATSKKEVQHALKDISFEIRRGEFFGIVGRNGSGKSTLLKILAAIYQPTKGRISTYGKLVPFIELGVGFNPELTGRDNVYLNGAMLGFSKKEVAAMYDEIVDFAELERFMDQKLKNYSTGMQVRLAFSMAVRAEADILLVDEVLAVGDADFQRKCFKYFKKLKADKKTVVFVTHDMSSVREFCDRAMLIDENSLKLIGTPNDVAREYSLLFIDNQKSNSDKDGQDNKKRWGNGDVKITSTKASLVNNELVVNVEASVHKQLNRLVYGLHITGQDGAEITAMNNRMMLVPDIEQLMPGQKVNFKWKMLNVFNDGKYSVTLTLIDDLGNTLDWYEGVTSFSVERTERSTTAVLPPVEVTTKIR
ncbi:MAG TPA: ABC transporter ATP-binding protein [Candidatus Saccharimonadales bacterium]|nr:ABC transporter ATP-binding protein [Candidatus Saccharimonadales bacterium]